MCQMSPAVLASVHVVHLAMATRSLGLRSLQESNIAFLRKHPFEQPLPAQQLRVPSLQSVGPGHVRFFYVVLAMAYLFLTAQLCVPASLSSFRACKALCSILQSKHLRLKPAEDTVKARQIHET